MRKKLITMKLFLFLIISPNAFADKCLSTSSCKLDGIPYLNQNNPGLSSEWFKDGSGNYYNSDKSTNLCGPTAMAALMAGVVKNTRTATLKSTSWIYDFFISSDLDKISKAAYKIIENSSYERTIDDLRAEGSYPEELVDAMTSAFQVGDADPVPYLYYSEFGLTYKSFCMFSKHIRGLAPDNNYTDLKNRMGMILQLGHYLGTETTNSGVKTTTYKRYGGHFVVIYGYTSNRLDILEVSGGASSTIGQLTSERLSRLYGTVKDDSGAVIAYNGVYYDTGDTAMEAIDDKVSSGSVGYLWDRRDPSIKYIPIIESVIYLGTKGD